jgi:hypothetical protein
MSLPGDLAGPHTAAEQVGLVLVGVAVVTAAGILIYRAWKRSRISPEELERRRRELLVASGKMGDAMLVEIRDDLLFYAYLVRGVEYTASQDVSRLKDRIPGDLSSIGPVAVRYDSRNPANSIVVAEQWSGLRLGESYRK